jgi:hypothetical protein
LIALAQIDDPRPLLQIDASRSRRKPTLDDERAPILGCLDKAAFFGSFHALLHWRRQPRASREERIALAIANVSVFDTLSPIRCDARLPWIIG